VSRIPRPRAGHQAISAERIWGPLYALPAVAVVIAFIGYPLGSIVYHSFTRWNGLGPPEWIGTRNFEFLLHDPIFFRALRNNLLFAISVPIQVFGALVLAYLIHERVPAWRFFRSTFFLPAVFSTVVVGLLVGFTVQLDGPLNDLLGSIGLGQLRQEWLGSAGSSIPIIIVTVVWANFGYSVLIYLAGMSSLDPQLAEAARMDGAGPWRILWRVYAPNLRRVMELVLVINTITAFTTMLTYVYVITRGGPGFSTYSTEYFVFDNAFAFQRLGYASAAGVALTLLVVGIGFLQIRALTRGKA
jgi:ABC-type sugar transport system permease subunit